jgi:hypothetical protein
MTSALEDRRERGGDPGSRQKRVASFMLRTIHH